MGYFRQLPLRNKMLTRLLVGAALLVPLPAFGEYRLAPGDVLEIGALGVPDLRNRATIDSDGQVFFPLLGELKAAGITLPELREKVKSLLPTKVFHARDRSIATSPDGVVTISPDEVTLTVAEYRPIYLNGDVAKPGAQTYRPGMTVRQAISLAGGYDTMRFRSGDPFLDSLDFRSEYYELWTEFAKIQAQVARFQAELDGKSTLDQQSINNAPLPQSISSQIMELETKQLDADNTDYANEKQYLSESVAREDAQIAVLKQQQEKEQQDADADAADYENYVTQFAKRLLTQGRLSDTRRLTLFSATRVLQTTVSLNQAQLQRAELARELGRAADERKKALLSKLQDANVRRATISARLQSVGDKLLYAGVVRSQLARGSGGEPDIKIFRAENANTRDVVAEEQTELMPGDVVEVTLRLEGLMATSTSAVPAVQSK
jgi:polysaccharide export outer membrane protein